MRERTKRGKDPWHGLWVFGDAQSDRWELVEEFRSRQHHEQTYRVMLHDAYVDTASSGYDKNSPNPGLPLAFHRAHPRTLRRWFLNTPAALFLGRETLIVALQPRRMLGLWQRLILPINRAAYRIPWLGHRRLVLSLDRHALVARRKLEVIREGGH